MSLTKYRAFLNVASTGSFSEAAQQLHCTQSAASRMIADLEQLWDVRLFSRFKSGAELTPEGEVLLPLVRDVILADESLKARLSSLTGLTTGTVRIATYASVATAWLPRVIGEFKRMYPHVNYEVLMGDYAEIERLVRTGRVDFGFSTPKIGEGLDSILVAEDELWLTVSESHRFAQMPSVPADMLNGESFFLVEMGRASFVSHYLEREKVNPVIELKTHHDYAILNMVKMNLGVSILPELVLTQPVEGVVLKKLEPRAYREIRLVLRQGMQLSLAAKKFLMCFSTVLKDEVLPTFGKAVRAFL